MQLHFWKEEDTHEENIINKKSFFEKYQILCIKTSGYQTDSTMGFNGALYARELEICPLNRIMIGHILLALGLKKQ